MQAPPPEQVIPLCHHLKEVETLAMFHKSNFSADKCPGYIGTFFLPLVRNKNVPQRNGTFQKN
jgi:hypothetical protein